MTMMTASKAPRPIGPFRCFDKEENQEMVADCKIELTHFADADGVLCWNWVTFDPRNSDKTQHEGGMNDSPSKELFAARAWLSAIGAAGK
jgi:hypothetical protein